MAAPFLPVVDSTVLEISLHARQQVISLFNSMDVDVDAGGGCVDVARMRGAAPGVDRSG